MDGRCQIYTVGQENLHFQSAVKLFGPFLYFFYLLFNVLPICHASYYYLSASRLEAAPPPVWEKSFSDRSRLICPHSPSSSSSQLMSSPPASLNTARAVMCQVAPSYYPHNEAASSAADIFNICNWIFLHCKKKRKIMSRPRDF